MQQFQTSTYQQRIEAIDPKGQRFSLGVWRKEVWPYRVHQEDLRLLLESAGHRYEILRTYIEPQNDAVTANPIFMLSEAQIQQIRPALRLRWLSFDDTHYEDRTAFNRALQEQVSQDPSALWAGIHAQQQGTAITLWLDANRGDAQTLVLLFEQLREACHQQLTQIIPHEVLQYGDFSAWQREQKLNPSAKAYWIRQQLEDLQQLPLGARDSDHQPAWQPAWHELNLDSALRNALMGVEEASLIALWSAFLWRCVGGAGHTLAIRRDARHADELHDFVGPLSQYLPIFIDPQRARHFVRLEEQCRDGLDALEQWQHDFQWSLLGEHWGARALCCAFALFEMARGQRAQNDHEEALLLQGEGEAIEPHALRLEIHRCRYEQRLVVRLQYNALLYDERDIAELSQQWQVFVNATLNQPYRTFSEQPVLDDAGRSQVLANARGDEASWAQATALDLILQQDAQALALVEESREWSYAELTLQVRQAAAYLQSMGLGAGDILGLCLSRSAEHIIYLLAAHYCGAAYVPIDPNIPSERLAQILADCQCPVAVIRQQNLEQFMAIESELELVVLERDAHEITQASPLLVPAHLKPEDRAYVIYTSGSSGRPKGVSVSHANISHYARAVMARLNLAADASIAALASVAADLGYTATYGALCTGRCLRVLPESFNLDAAALAQSLMRRPVSALKAVPFHLCALMNAEPQGDWLPDVVICGGERLEQTLFEQLRSLNAQVRLFNHYGPSETTVGVLCGEVNEIRLGSAPLGAPLSSCSAYVLDEQREPVAPGSFGELYLGGAHLSQGYYRRDLETKQVFVSNPFADEEDPRIRSNRLYRTGDRVFLNARGELRFIGRMDDQVKIRGHRVEPEEVAGTLRKANGVQCAVVLAVDGELRAYISGPLAQRPDLPSLQQWLRQRLPVYACPAHIFWLDTLPLNATGKIDRPVLAALPVEQAAGAAAAASNKTEAQLLAIWKALLQREDIGVHDNFFQQGGDSILTIQMVARARQKGIVLTPQQVFDLQTVARLVEAAEQTAVVNAEQGQITGDVALSENQQQFFLRHAAEPHFAFHNRVLTVNQNLDIELLSQAVDYLLRRHDALRLRFEAQATSKVRSLQESATPQWRQWSEHSAHLVLHDHLVLRPLSPGQDVAIQLNTALQELAYECDLANGPLCRFVYFQNLAQQEDDTGQQQCGHLLIAAHRLAIDGVSWRIILADFIDCYQRLLRSGDTPSDLKTSAFRQWVDAVAEWRPCEAQLNPWPEWQDRDDQLATALQQYLQRKELDKGNEHTAQRQGFALSNATSQQLLQLSAQREDDITSLLLAAVVQAMQRWCGVQQLWIDVESHGRGHGFDYLDISRTCGYFACVIPQWFAVQKTLNDTLQHCLEQRALLPSNDFAFAQMKSLNSDPAMAALPQAGMLLSYLGQFDQAIGENEVFQPSHYWIPPLRHGDNPRQYWLECTMGVVDGCLQVSWLYSGQVLPETAIEQLNHHLQHQLQALAALSDTAPIETTETAAPTQEALTEASPEPASTADQASKASGEPEGDISPVEEALSALSEPVAAQALASVALDHSDYSRLLPPYLAPEPVEVVLPLPGYLHGMLSYAVNHPGSAVYKVQNAFNWEGPADEACLQLAWQALMQRHQALRMSVYELDADPAVLVIHREVPLPWSQHDWRDLSFADQEQAYAELLEESLQFDFLPSQAPMMQLHWILLGEERQRLLWVHHHAIADGWSAAVLWRELFQLYEALLAQQQAQAPSQAGFDSAEATLDIDPLDIEPFDIVDTSLDIESALNTQTITQAWPKAAGFEDYLRWRLSVDRPQLEQYWQQRFAGLKRYSQCFAGLPQRLQRVDKQRSSDESMQELEWLAPASLSHNLNQFLQTQGITAALLFQAAWALFLSRCEDVDQVRFGMAAAGRPAELDGVEQLVGLCLNAVPCQIQVHAELELGQWLQQLRLQSHQDEHHAQLSQRELSQSLGLSQPLFDTFLVCENLPHGSANLEQVRLTHVNGFSYNHYPLTLMLVPGEQWYLKVKYNAALVREDRIAWLLQAFSSLLLQMCQSVEQRLADIHWAAPITREAWKQKHQAHHAGAVEILYESMLPDVVRSIPDSHLALIQQDQRIHYAQLRERACRLAQYLCNVNVQVGDRVALVLPVDVDHIVALLAVHFCGATAVLVDTQASAQVQQHILDESACATIITHSRWMNHLLAADDLAELVVLDRDADEIAECEAVDPQVSVFASSIAYIVYEQGLDEFDAASHSSTAWYGRLVSHATLARDARQLMAPMGLVEDAVVACVAGDAGGFAYRAMFCALIHGLTLALEPLSETAKAAQVVQSLSEHSVSCVLLSSAMLSRALNNAAAPSQLPPYVLLGDLQASADFIERVQQRYPHTQVLSLLCESVVGMSAACCQWQVDDPQEGPQLQVQQLLNHADLYIHDHSLRPVAAACAAGLSIVGAGFADAYEQQSKRTAQHWCIDPQRKGRRLYGTAWRALLNNAEDVTLWPRFAHPRLMRPYDERLQQLEQRLRKTQGLDGWQWLAHGHQAEQGFSLVLYGPLDERTWHAIQNQAERAACPVYWQALAPLDRATNLALNSYVQSVESLTNDQAQKAEALPQGASSEPSTAASLHPHQQTVQAQLLTLWKDLLQRDDIGLEQAFLSIGGDSILVLQMVARARALGLALDPQMVFEQQTIAAIAAQLAVAHEPSLSAEEAAAAQTTELISGSLAADTIEYDAETEELASTEATPSSSAFDGQNCILAPIQRRFFTLVTEQSHHYVQARVLQLPRDADEHSLRQALYALWQQHPALRLSFDTTPLVVGQWPSAEFLPLDAVTPSDLLHCETVQLNEGWQAAIDEATQYWFAQLDLAGPLFRALWLDGENGSSRLVLFAHHLVVDGVSWRALQQDLILAYEAAKQGQGITQADNSAAFSSWSQALERCRGQLAAESRHYWQQQAARFASAQSHVALESELRQWQNEGLLNADYSERHEQFSIQLSQALLSDAVSINELRVEELLLAALARACADPQIMPRFPVPDALDIYRQAQQGDTPVSFHWPLGVGNAQNVNGFWLDLEGHGRDVLARLATDEAHNHQIQNHQAHDQPLEANTGLAVERTVGWFTKLYPVKLPSAADWHDAVLLTNTRHSLQQAQQYSDAYLLLRYGDEVPTTQQLPKPALKFNYFGRIVNDSSQAFALADEQARGLHSELQTALYSLGIDAVITGRAGAEQLHMIWRYPSEFESRVEGLIAAFANALSSLVDHCIEWADRQGIEEPDPELEAEYSELDQLLDELETLL
jgi:amino acid adenylation domain-containing protein/non-ribosomal peptide synthase protein (TIGR01720 family)